MFFHLRPQRGILNDINVELIKTYKEIKTNWNQIQSELKKLHETHNQDLYYKIRGQKPINDTEIAIRFLYLNRTCWNGLYRVNKNNEFNVPIGTKTNVIVNTDDFEQAAKLLTDIELFSQDFESIILNSKGEDFIFVDPPYTVKHNNNGFVKYNENLFSWDDQIRLRDSVQQAIDRGSKVLVLNANHDSVKELYQNLGEFYTVSRSSVISGQKSGRGIYQELAVKCF